MQSLSSALIEKKQRPIKIMQFGEGNFLRAFVDYFLQQLNDQSLINSDVVVVQPMPFGRVKELSEQDGLYTLFLEGIQQSEIIKQHQVIDVLSDFINPFQELSRYLDYAKSEKLDVIISNTTEAGIVYQEEVISKNVTPESFPGKLLLLLRERYLHFSGDQDKGFDIVPCELIDDNGTTLNQVLNKLAIFNNYDENFIDWLNNANRFYNTLVDRIVPGYPKETCLALEAMLNYKDHSMVKGEVFHLWVIEGPKSLKEKLPFHKSDLHVFYVEDIKPYKERKVKILNGSHTAMVPIAYLMGLKAVKESVEHPILQSYIKKLIFDEIVPTINLPKSEMIQFSLDVLERYSNPFIHHLLMSIALNNLTKFKTRIYPTILDSLNRGVFPKHALFSLAALLVFYRGYDEQNQPIDLQDNQDLIDTIQSIWKEETIENAVALILNLQHFSDTVLTNPEIINYVGVQVKQIISLGMKESLENHLKGD